MFPIPRARSHRADTLGAPGVAFGACGGRGQTGLGVSHDRTLDALASTAPSSMAALAQINGIGAAKLESYGDELLALLAAARDDS